MSASAAKLSPALKSLISAPHARGGALPSPNNIKSLFQRISDSARSNDLGIRTWLCLSTASLVTMNSPAAVCDLYSYATSSMSKPEDKAKAAAIMRETGLKCISFSGVGAIMICAQLVAIQLTWVSTDPENYQRFGSSSSTSGRRCETASE